MSKPHLPVLSNRRLTSPYGYRTHPITKRKTFHDGVDYAPKVAGINGTPIFAVRSGRVRDVGNNRISGKFIIIEHNTDNYVSLYQHLATINVKSGTKVTEGQKIGVMGTTGRSTGIHLHFTVSTRYPVGRGASGTTVDPEKYLKTDNTKRRNLKLTKPQMNGSDVRKAQELLSKNYFYPEKGAKNNGVDGYYGPKTKDAVKRYQSMNGLVVDGKVGPNTWSKLLG